MPRSARRHQFYSAIVALLLLLGAAACGDDDSDAADQSAAANSSVNDTAENGATDEGAEADDPETTTSTTEAVETTTTTEAAPASGEACLLGTWLVDNDHWGEVFQQLGQAEGGAGFQVLGVTGVGTTEFRADGTAETIYEGWTIAATAEGLPGEMTITRDGVDQAAWSTEGANLAMVDTEVNSVVTTSMGGMVLPGGGGGDTHDPSLIAGDATFDCTGDTLNVVIDGVTLVMHRVG